MIWKPSLVLALKYLRLTKRSFASFIAWVSIAGITFSVAVLITVLSVMNGFDSEIKKKIFKDVDHIVISNSRNQPLIDWKSLRQKILTEHRSIKLFPFIQGQALLLFKRESIPILLRGIIPSLEKNPSNFAPLMSNSNPPKLLVLNSFAANYGLYPDDIVTIVVASRSFNPLALPIREKTFQIATLPSTNFTPGQTAYLNIDNAQNLLQMSKDSITGLALKTDDLMKAPILAEKIQSEIGSKYYVNDWTNQYGNFYSAVKMEKNIMFYILFLLIGLATFNLVSTLVILVVRKGRDIAILRTIGATPNSIAMIFLFEGLLIGMIGILAGTAIGILLSCNINAILDWLQNTFNVQIFFSQAYFVDTLPSRLSLKDILQVDAITIILVILAAIYPARRGARMEIVKGLRYE